MAARSLTLVLPAYNEAARIGPALDELFGYLRRRGEQGRYGSPGAAELPAEIEVLVVDDGSTDRTAEIVRGRPEFESEVGGATLRLLRVPHGGKGAAVRAGMLAARGELVIFADADMATPPDQIPLLVRALADHDVALGSRIQPDGRDMRRSQPLLRRLLGRFFHVLASAWVVGSVRDTQCGFKGFTSAAARDLFSHQRITSIVFDVELIYLARRRGYRLAIVPIAWTDRRGSRMRARPGLALRVAWDLLRIPFLHRSLAAAGLGPSNGSASEATPSRRQRLRRAAEHLLPPVAVAMFLASVALWVALSLRAGGFAFDFLAYDAAARRLLAGQSLYDTTYQATGTFGLFYYPPPFAFLVVPFVLLPPGLGAWAWTAAVAGATLAAVAIMPVRNWVRWLTLGLAGLSWPVVFAIGLGQVGPFLLLVFATGWRWLASDGALGVAASLGTLIKVQPILLFGWMVCQQRWGAAAVGIGIGLAITLVATLVVSPAAWLDLLGLMSRVADPVTVPANVTVGAVAYQFGLSRSDAVIVHWLGVGAVMAAWLAAAIRRPPVVGYLTTVVVSQLVSPLLWDHYAMLLLLPVAYLVDRGWSWAALVPLATPWLLAGHIPAVVYPLSFGLVLGALLVVPEPAIGHVREAGTTAVVTPGRRSEGPDTVPSSR